VYGSIAELPIAETTKSVNYGTFMLDELKFVDYTI
jgi:hypothetical protein